MDTPNTDTTPAQDFEKEEKVVSETDPRRRVPGSRFEVDEEATAHFQRVARKVGEWKEAKDGRLSSFMLAHIFGATNEEIAEMGLPPVPSIEED